MDKEGFLHIKVLDLERYLDEQSRCLCGMVLKRFELHDDKNTIKKETRELIYESFRNLKVLLLAYNSGLTHTTKFEFTQRKASAQ